MLIWLNQKKLFFTINNQHTITEKFNFTVKWDDPRLKIVWPIKKPILSKRDK